MAKFTAYVETKTINSRCSVLFEIPDEELPGLSEVERDALLSKRAEEALADTSQYTIWWTEGDEG